MPKEKYNYDGEPIPYIPVAVEQSNLPGNKNKYGRIRTKTVYEDELLKEIEKKHIGIPKETLLFAMMVIQSEMLDCLKHGNAVSLCGMGVLSPQVDGAVTDKQISMGRGLKYTLKFTPSEQAMKTVKNYRTQFISKKSTQPIILKVTLQRTGETLTKISEEELLSVKGQNLQFRKDRHFQSKESGIFFENTVTKKEYRLEPERLITKSDTHLRFYTPKLPKGDYRMYIQKATVCADKTIHTTKSGDVFFTVGR